MPRLDHLPYIDKESQYLIAMSVDHHARHESQAFMFSNLYTNLASGGIIYIEIRIPDAQEEVAFKRAEVVSDKVIKVEAIEAPTITTIGTNAIPLIQRNRRSTHTASTLVFDNPSGVSAGTVLRTGLEGAGQKPVSGAATDDLGWSLKNSTTYVLKLTNLDAQTAAFVNVAGYIFEIDRV